jgi:hypothetical protein
MKNKSVGFRLVFVIEEQVWCTTFILIGVCITTRGDMTIIEGIPFAVEWIAALSCIMTEINAA